MKVNFPLIKYIYGNSQPPKITNNSETNTNADSPISLKELDSELEMLRLVNPVQPANAESPIHDTELGMSMLVSPVQPASALYPIVSTVLGITV